LSKTSLFVANLPFKVNDEQLRQLFANFHVSEAHVMWRRNGRSKGYGFVDLPDEKMQQEALAAVHDVDVDGRKLVVKVAMGRPVPEAEPAQ